MTDFTPEPWHQTYTGRRVNALDMRPDDVDILDIAHSLAHTCRYKGHCARFYSVAEHSVYASRIVPSLEALLHDAAEAYSPFGDVPRPYKHLFPFVVEVEAKIEVVIAYHAAVVHQNRVKERAVLIGQLRRALHIIPTVDELLA